MYLSRQVGKTYFIYKFVKCSVMRRQTKKKKIYRGLDSYELHFVYLNCLCVCCSHIWHHFYDKSADWHIEGNWLPGDVYDCELSISRVYMNIL